MTSERSDLKAEITELARKPCEKSMLIEAVPYEPSPS